MTQVILGKSRVREICMPGSVRAKAEWLSYSTTGPETERLTGRCLAMTLSGARLNGDFSLPSQLPIWTWSAPRHPVA